jgi:hypothetical protein
MRPRKERRKVKLFHRFNLEDVMGITLGVVICSIEWYHSFWLPGGTVLSNTEVPAFRKVRVSVSC